MSSRPGTEKSGPDRETFAARSALVEVWNDRPMTDDGAVGATTSRDVIDATKASMGRRKVSSPSAVEGKEIVAKLDEVLTEAGVYASTSASSGAYRVTVQLGYRAARRLTEVLRGGDRG